jgi:hypothetical protein
MAHHVVALTGSAGSGKDFTFGLIRCTFCDAERQSFADPLKRILVAEDPIVDDKGNRLSALMRSRTFEELKREVPEIRRLLQKMGTEGIRRELGEDVFLDAVMKKFGESGSSVTVFTDLRFENEARAIQALGGTIIRVVRPGANDAMRHSSETEAAAISADFEFENDGDERHVRDLMDFLKGRFVSTRWID